METLLRDLRYSFRMLARAPGFTALAVATLALGIGANTAIFTVANSVLLRSLPYKDPGQLVRISTHRDGSCCVSLPFFNVLSAANRSFSGVAAYQFDAVNLAVPDGAEQIDAERVTGNFFDVLGAKLAAGRTFTPEEDQPGGNQVVLIGYELATRIFGGAQNAVGQHLALDSKDYTIIGVLPPKFGVQLLGRQPEIWMPRIIEFSLTTPARVNLGGMYYEAIGRLRPGVTSAQALAETEVIFQQYKHDKPGNFDATSDVAMTVSNLQSNLVANVRPTLLILSAAVGFVLLIACANVANLLLFRALSRRKEFAVRSALGAPRSTLIRQLLTESVLMAVMSGALGIFLGYLGTRFLAAFAQTNLPQVADIPMDLRVLSFTAAISVLSGILFGLTPSLQLSRPDLGGTLSDEGRNSTGSRRRNRARSILVAAQVALSMVLLIGSGLLIRSFMRLRKVDPGFGAKNTLTAKTFLPPSSYPQPADRIAFYRSALQHLQSIPGVDAAAISTALPVLPTHGAPARFEGEPDVDLGRRTVVLIESISPDYPKATRMPLVAGRAFNDLDDAQSTPVVMVNQATARRFWPNQDPLGKLVWVGRFPPCQVVGVLGDIKNDSLASPTQPEVFFPYPQLASPMLYVSIRSSMDPHSLVSALRAQIVAVNRGQPISDVQTMEERLESASAQTRSMMLLIGVFSATALILALVGIYGVIAYSVAQRTQELGIRIALGASSADIFRLVIGNGLRLAVAGTIIGLVASFALTRLMASLLFQTSATDPLTFAGSALVFAAVAALASYLPARRAMRINPTDALRSA
ncbi:MAG: ABC transporter permease [Candidatus Acidiferrales bacterium]|jgi:predicted permease